MNYKGAIKCPYCGTYSADYIFKREWKSGMWNVNEVICKACDSKFRIYFGKKKDGSSMAYTLPKLLMEH